MSNHLRTPIIILIAGLLMAIVGMIGVVSHVKAQDAPTCYSLATEVPKFVEVGYKPVSFTGEKYTALIAALKTNPNYVGPEKIDAAFEAEVNEATVMIPPLEGPPILIVWSKDGCAKYLARYDAASFTQTLVNSGVTF